jgi:hypothetical protein
LWRICDDSVVQSALFLFPAEHLFHPQRHYGPIRPRL